ncbi:MAG: hypothetical protein NVS4B3_11700 [Gemmatimonadaceae bacterium]
MTSHCERKRISVAAAAVCGSALLLSAACRESPLVPTQSAPGRSVAAPSSVATVYATGLTSPRNLKFGPDGLLYVSEGGLGGNMNPTGFDARSRPCPPVNNMFTVPGPYGSGYTGKVSRVWPSGRVETIAEHLPSSHDGTNYVLGVTDVAFVPWDGDDRQEGQHDRGKTPFLVRGQALYALIEGGGCSRGLPSSPAGVIRINRDGSFQYVADISAWIRTHPNAVPQAPGPNGDEEPDGVPHMMITVGRSLYVVETNHNFLLEVNPRTGAISALADFSALFGDDVNPTVIEHHGSEFYVGDFGTDGGKARLWKAGAENGRPGSFSIVDATFNPIVGLAFAGNKLFALETFRLDNVFAPNTSRAVRRNADASHTVVADGMNFAIGLTRGPDGAFYTSTTAYGLENGPDVPDVSMAAGIGKIVRFSPKGDHEEFAGDLTR